MPSNISLNVTSQTTAAQLDDFAKQLGDGERLKGKKNDDGSITLYSSSNEPGLMSKLSGRADKRAAAAQQAIRMVAMSNPHLDSEEKNQVGKLLNRPVVQQLSTDALKSVANFMSAIEKSAVADQKGPDIPSLQDLPFNARTDLRDGTQALGSLIQTRSQDKPAYDTAVRDMATSLANALSTEPMASLYPNAAVSDGTELIQALTDKIMVGVTDAQLATVGKKAAEGLAAQVVLKASDILLGGSITPGTTDVVIGDTTYERRELLGKPGAFGTAYRYEATDGSGSIAVKFQNSNDDEKKDAFRQEIPAHKLASASGHPNILEFKAAMRTEAGGFAIAMELATGGEVSDIVPTLDQMVEDSLTTPEAILATKLTLIHDMAAGLLDMHATSGMTHLDFKPGNAFISTDGQVKVADFGTAVTSENPFVRDAEAVDQPRWRDGTALYLAEDMPGVKHLIKTGAEMKKEEFAQIFFPESIVDGKYDADALRQVSVDSVRFMDRIVQNYETAAKDDYLATTTIDGTAADMFSLGISAINILLGEDYLSPEQTGKFMKPVGTDSINHVKGNVLAFGDHPGAIHPSTGDPVIDELLNALTHPDPSQRPHDMQSLLSLQAFQLPNVATDEARSMISGVVTNDGNKVASFNELFA